MSKRLKWYSFRCRTLLIVLLITLPFVYVAYRIRVATRVLPMGSGPAGPAVSSDPFQKIWSDGKVALVGLGDSITRGLGAQREHTYFELLQKNDDIQYPDMEGCDLRYVFPGLEAHNYAQDYTVTKEHVENQLPRVPIYPPDIKGVVVITSGGNDLIHDYGRSKPTDGAMYGCSYKQAIEWTENIKARLTKLIEGVNGKFPGGCQIFFANIYDPTDGVSDPQSKGLPRWPDAVKVISLTNQKIAELCNSYENVHLVDIHSGFLGHGIHCTEFWRRYYNRDDPHYWYYENLEDPNRRGYDAIRRLFLTEMIKVLPVWFGR
jgi:lysophospholipase L1-like esterase